MGNCVPIRKTPEYHSRPNSASGADYLHRAAATDGERPELNLGDGEIPPGSPLSARTKKTHVEFVVLEVGGIPHVNRALEKISAKNGYFCEVRYENNGSKTMIYRTVTRFPAASETATSIHFNPSTESIDKFAENVVKVPRTLAEDDTKLAPMIRIRVYASYWETSYSEGVSQLIGETTFPVSELEAKQEWKLWMFTPSSEYLVYDRAHHDTPMFVKISVPSGSPPPVVEKPDKRCVMITRGTRGDVQPCVALARGLAEQKNWEVTIVTEMRYRDLVIKNSKVSRGSIHFRPSGGDTESRIDRPLARWFVMQDHSAFQLIMLARAEREFFESEPAFSYFTKDARPDYLIFGFNTANIALILSESFRLPICGFILQPTVIPSKQYPAIVSVGSADPEEATMTHSIFAELKHARRFSWGLPRFDVTAKTPEPEKSDAGTESNGLDVSQNEEEDKTFHDNEMSMLSTQTPKIDDPAALWTRCDIPVQTQTNVFPSSMDTTHKVIRMLKPLLENNIFTSRINAMRQAHGLGPQKGDDLDFKVLQSLNVPMICPINTTAFGGKPVDWNSCIDLTDFIFLSPTAGQQNSTKDPLEMLAPKLQKFIREAKEAKAPIVAIGFSSMPVSRSAILNLSTLVAKQSSRHARVIALVGIRPSEEVTDPQDEADAQALKDSGRLLEIGGAPFGILFPFCDFLIVHGGLGTTGEALRAGKPCLITGVMLFDQRFWGRRVYELGCGPKPIHIRNLRSEIVKVVEKGLTPGNPWAENARKMAEKLKADGHGDGIEMNVQAIAEACERSANGFQRLPSWQSARALLTTENAPEVEHSVHPVEPAEISPTEPVPKASTGNEASVTPNDREPEGERDKKAQVEPHLTSGGSATSEKSGDSPEEPEV